MKEEGFKCYTAFYCEPVLRGQNCDLLYWFLLDDVQQHSGELDVHRDTVLVGR